MFDRFTVLCILILHFNNNETIERGSIQDYLQLYVKGEGDDHTFPNERFSGTPVRVSNIIQKFLCNNSSNYHGFFLNMDWIVDLCILSSESWIVDDMSSIDICLIGSVVRTDPKSLDRLREYVSSFRSPFLLDRNDITNSQLDLFFGEASLVRHFMELSDSDKSRFLRLLCSIGSAPMLEPFEKLKQFKEHIASGVLLGRSACVGNIDVVHRLLAIGVNGVSAVSEFLFRNCEKSGVDDQVFKTILDTLVGDAKWTPSNGEIAKALFVTLRSPKTLTICPGLVESLLSKGVSCAGLLSRGATPPYEKFPQSLYRLVEINTFLLPCAMEHGHPWVVELLLRYGADVTTLARDGNTIIQRAINNDATVHPRAVRGPWKSGVEKPADVPSEADSEILNLIRKAFDLRFKGSERFEDYGKPFEKYESPAPQEKSVFSLRTLLDTVLASRQIMALHNGLESIFPGFSPISSVSFSEALFMRLLFFLSYILLFVHEALAFATGQRRIPMPTRTLLSGIALLLLALHWSLYSMGFSWGK